LLGSERRMAPVESLPAGRQKAVIGDLDEAVALRANYVLFILLSSPGPVLWRPAVSDSFWIRA
jgi:hypothetical protein